MFMIEPYIRGRISLAIANYWTSNGFLTETNRNSGTLVAFDWSGDYLTEINTNIDLSDLETGGFGFDDFVYFLKQNMFTLLLGLRNLRYYENPSTEWIDRLKEILKSNVIDYDEYIIDKWPAPIPEFDVPDNVFILRYSFDPNSKIDALAANWYEFEEFMKNSEWKKYYKDIESEKKNRVIVFCSNVENFILHGEFIK
jgi:hypothetical protein